MQQKQKKKVSIQQGSPLRHEDPNRNSASTSAVNHCDEDPLERQSDAWRQQNGSSPYPPMSPSSLFSLRASITTASTSLMNHLSTDAAKERFRDLTLTASFVSILILILIVLNFVRLMVLPFSTALFWALLLSSALQKPKQALYNMLRDASILRKMSSNALPPRSLQPYFHTLTSFIHFLHTDNSSSKYFCLLGLGYTFYFCACFPGVGIPLLLFFFVIMPLLRLALSWFLQISHVARIAAKLRWFSPFGLIRTLLAPLIREHANKIATLVTIACLAICVIVVVFAVFLSLAFEARGLMQQARKDFETNTWLRSQLVLDANQTEQVLVQMSKYFVNLKESESKPWWLELSETINELIEDDQAETEIICDEVSHDYVHAYDHSHHIHANNRTTTNVNVTSNHLNLTTTNNNNNYNNNDNNSSAGHARNVEISKADNHATHNNKHHNNIQNETPIAPPPPPRQETFFQSQHTPQIPSNPNAHSSMHKLRTQSQTVSPSQCPSTTTPPTITTTTTTTPTTTTTTPKPLTASPSHAPSIYPIPLPTFAIFPSPSLSPHPRPQHHTTAAHNRGVCFAKPPTTPPLLVTLPHISHVMALLTSGELIDPFQLPWRGLLSDLISLPGYMVQRFHYDMRFFVKISKIVHQLVEPLLSASSVMFTNILQATVAFSDHFFSWLVFFGALNHLLTLECDVCTLATQSLPLPPSIANAINSTVSGVFTLTVYMFTFNALFTWLVCSMCGASFFLQLISFGSGILAVCPLVFHVMIAIPSAIEVFMFRSGTVMAGVLLAAHFALPSQVWPAIHREVPHIPHSIVNWSVLFGMYAFNLEGVVFGPMLACVPVIAYRLYVELIAGEMPAVPAMSLENSPVFRPCDAKCHCVKIWMSAFVCLGAVWLGFDYLPDVPVL